MVISDDETRVFIQRAVGYFLTGSTKEDVLFILHGSSSNGKSTFIQTISTLLELDEGKRLSESLVKQLTGGDTISTRHLFGRDLEYEPTYKLWISTNHKFKIYGDDDGIWRRICLIYVM